MKGERELYFKILWLNPIIAFKIIISAILSIINLVNIEFFNDRDKIYFNEIKDDMTRLIMNKD